ncbi:Dak1 domain-containing protein [Xylariomycetidae sp. FL2044]|nr:Dak1 domain-containing protein [Xylariomycetidae sp. FL2044]
MSTKHYFLDTAANTLVPRALKALAAANPHLSLIESERVVYCSHNHLDTVSVISGGGSGHEPGWSGFVGEGLLSAVACGDIFASPSTKQVLAAVKSSPSSEGTILMITNYTGDKLHFGLAAERAKAEGLCKNIVVLPQTDDVSLGRTKSKAVGRRGLPGHVIGMKIVSGAAAKRCSFQKCVDIGVAVNAQTVSIGSSLDHCHVPGRQGHESIPQDVCVVGSGIHNEPGAQRISPFPSVENLISQCLAMLCDPTDPERAFVNFENSEDSVALLVNNFGGLSNLELGALTDEVIGQLEKRWKIRPSRIFSGTFETSLNAPGFSISLCNVSKAAEESSTKVSELLELLDSKTTAVSWPNPCRTPETNGFSKTLSPSIVNGHMSKEKISDDEDIRVDPKLLDEVIRTGCKAAIAAEPNLTKWDMVMGDGDCGEAVQGVSEAIIRKLDSGIASRGSVLEFLYSTTDAVDDMGGTLGAIFGILLSAFSSSLKSKARALPEGSGPPEASTYSQALAEAVASLKTYTSAREGDRTVMDVLLPFADRFAETNNFHSAVERAHQKAEATKYLKPRFGRATYVAETAGQELPDPGAWALYEMLNGMAVALKANGV